MPADSSFEIYKSRVQSIQHKLALELGSFIPAAVLIPFYEKNGEPFLLFAKRTQTVRHHKGQISFPGGAYELTDPDLRHTALRETEEEIGLDQSCVEILAELDDMFTPTRFRVTPFVGVIPYPYSFKINPHETAELIEVPLRHLLLESHHRTGYRMYQSHIYEIHYYDFGEHTIWGVTGQILNDLLKKIQQP